MTVHLVGAGPGDPDLLTLRAASLLAQADVIVHDRLVDARILASAAPWAELVDVGKSPGSRRNSQREIDAILIDRARRFGTVVRLKGGDPFVFGRGGEEIESLSAEGIAFQVVPGISAANGCAAYAGIPLTHRDHAQACVFVTGHPRKDGSLDLPWASLAAPRQTVVIYMGLGSLAMLCRELMAAGLAPDWPAAVVEHGTRPQQRVVTGSLADLDARVREQRISGPCLIIVGSVVRLRDRLAWFRQPDV